MRKRLLFVLLLLLLLPWLAQAEDLAFTVTPELMRPGKTERISFTAPADGTAQLSLLDDTGAQAAVIRDEIRVTSGVNQITWDGMSGILPTPEGQYSLALSMNGETVSRALEIGRESPQILSVNVENATLSENGSWQATVRVNMPGTLMIRLKLADDQWLTIAEAPAAADTDGVYAWDGFVDGARVPGGTYPVQLKLTDEDGFSGNALQLFIDVAAIVTPSPTPAPTPTPAPRVVIPSAVTTQQQETNYWTLPVGVMDEEAIWNVMMQPITVLNGNEKDVYKLRRTPDNSAKKENVVGEVTYASQGVHILETRDDGWTLVETYNSSYGPDCASRPGFGVTDDLIQGYVKTSLLKTITPKTDYGLLVDKLEQKMYIFSDGKCIGTLLVSTGLNNPKQSWNETPSGEFLMISRMGGFPAGNLWCAYGMRINGGCAIHEVPYIGDADTPPSARSYSANVKLLGQKASHGCIRVQKDKNEQGQNMEWLFKNIKVYTKVLVWDDTWRTIPYPDDDTPLFYNPSGGKYFHVDDRCYSVSKAYLPLKEFTYGELDDAPYTKLDPCPYCTQIMRKEDIDAVNRQNNPE